MNSVNAMGKGGDVIFIPGKGGIPKDEDGNPLPGHIPGVDGSIVFRMADGTDFLRLEPGGRALVRGTEVKDDRQVYLWMSAWLAHASGRLGKGQDGGKDAVHVPC